MHRDRQNIHLKDLFARILGLHFILSVPRYHTVCGRNPLNDVRLKNNLKIVSKSILSLQDVCFQPDAWRDCRAVSALFFSVFLKPLSGVQPPGIDCRYKCKEQNHTDQKKRIGKTG
jgi:hypothetical protein